MFTCWHRQGLQWSKMPYSNRPQTSLTAQTRIAAGNNLCQSSSKTFFAGFSFHCLALAGKCGILAPPSNSFVSYNPPERTDQGTARYACLPGYERFGDAERKCVDGQWAGQAPLCAINIAIRQNAQQSSNATEYTVLRGSRQGYEAAAYLAVDGTKLYCSKTNMEAQSYWHVTFVKAYNVVAVRIYGDLLPGLLIFSLLPHGLHYQSKNDREWASVLVGGYSEASNWW